MPFDATYNCLNSGDKKTATPEFLRHPQLVVPVELCRFAQSNGLIKSFDLFLHMKMYSDGKMHITSPALKQIRADLRLKDDRTFDKHIEKLRALNWVGYNPASGYYFIRGFHYIRLIHKINNRQGVIFNAFNLNNIKVFVYGVLISAIVIGQFHSAEKDAKRKSRTATTYGGVAKQSNRLSHSNLPYFGVSNAGIGAALNCSTTLACNMKRKAEEAGMIKTRKQFHLLDRIKEPDYKLRSYLYEQYPKLIGRIRFLGKSNREERWIEVLQQLHDEIIPKLHFKAMAKFAKLKIPETLANVRSLLLGEIRGRQALERLLKVKRGG
ncbi:hypothetical protein [Paracnuella aquatica]|uniref:hypothetical protein n=1 Tax=Paracnuella aquatica TaxID=2268757 RepID=UPI000DEED057|nr:hypothetical protein [Paracnuella aquatica]RPD50639.1 hypothetical protein DRJ53_06865 [Paracnuella aquatica]